MRGDSGVPLESLVQFVRLSYSCDQREVVEVLFDKLVQDTQVCVGVWARGHTGVCGCVVGGHTGVCGCVGVWVCGGWARRWVDVCTGCGCESSALPVGVR